MELFIDLFGNLVLTFLTVVVTIIGVLFSYYQDGVSILVSSYENERLQAEKKISDKNRRRGNKGININELEMAIKDLKSIKKSYERKLKYLDMRRQTKVLFSVYFFAFIFVELSAIFLTNGPIFRINEFISLQLTSTPFLLIGLAIFLYATYQLYMTFSIIIDIKKASDDNQKTIKEDETKRLVDALNKIPTMADSTLKNVALEINTQRNASIIRGNANVQNQLNLIVINGDEKMAKNIEVGFVFPGSFKVEESTSRTIYNDVEKNQQIVRYHLSSIQGDTRFILSPIKYTTSQTGKFSARYFIKGENISLTKQNLSLVIE